MIGMRKVCINALQIQNAHMFNQQAQLSGDGWQRMPVPEPKYVSARFCFRGSTILDYFIDPESPTKDIIIFFHHRGEIRLEYDQILEAKLETIFSTMD